MSQHVRPSIGDTYVTACVYSRCLPHATAVTVVEQRPRQSAGTLSRTPLIPAPGSAADMDMNGCCDERVHAATLLGPVFHAQPRTQGPWEPTLSV